MSTLIDRRRTPHALAVGLCALAVASWALALVATLQVAGTRDERSGAVLAVFPQGASEAEVLARVARADGVVMRGTWLANVWQVHGEQAGFARSLRAQGAVLVLPTLPYAAFTVGGCGFSAAANPGRAPIGRQAGS